MRFPRLDGRGRRPLKPCPFRPVGAGTQAAAASRPARRPGRPDDRSAPGMIQTLYG